MKLKINENPRSNVKKALFGDPTGKIKTFAIITAENPMGIPYKSSTNNKRNGTLKDYLKNRGIKYTKLIGDYGNKEHSFMLYNVALGEVMALARDYEQESFFYGTNEIPSVITYYETRDNCRTYPAVETKKGVASLKDAEEFFSRCGDFQFKIDMKCFEDMRAISESIIDESEILKSLEENRTPFSRMRCRKRAIGQ